MFISETCRYKSSHVVDLRMCLLLWYCWWFRNLAPLGCQKNPENSGISWQPQLFARISEQCFLNHQLVTHQKLVFFHRSGYFSSKTSKHYGVLWPVFCLLFNFPHLKPATGDFFTRQKKSISISGIMKYYQLKSCTRWKWHFAYFLIPPKWVPLSNPCTALTNTPKLARSRGTQLL